MDESTNNPMEIGFGDDLMDKLESVPLLVDYFATCGPKHKNLIDYMHNYQSSNMSLQNYLKPDMLRKHGLVADILSRYPPVDRPSVPFPLDIPNFCFSCGYKFERKKDLEIYSAASDEFLAGAKSFNEFIAVNPLYTKKLSFVQTNESGAKIYIV